MADYWTVYLSGTGQIYEMSKVYVKNFGRGSPWLPGVVQEARGPVSYTVELEDGRVVRRHVDYVRVRTPTDGVPQEADESDDFSRSTFQL